MDSNLKAKTLLASYLNTYSKANILNENKIEILNMETCDALIYNLRTIIKTNKTSDEYFNLNETPSHDNLYSASSFNKTYPIEVHTYNLASSKLRDCYKCNGLKYLSKENETFGFNNERNVSTHGVINSETGEYIHYNARNTANGSYRMKCNLCNGNGKLNRFKRDTLVEDCIYDVRVKCTHKSVPLKSIIKNKGNLIVNQTKKKLSPISSFPDDEIFEFSNDLLKRHEARLRNLPEWEVVNQTHQLIAIPITSYTAKYKQKIIQFYIFTETNDIFVNKKNHECSLL